MNTSLRSCLWMGVGILGATLVARASTVVEAGGAGTAGLIFADAAAVESAVSLRVPADYLTLRMSVTSDAATVGERLELLEDVDRTLRVLAENTGIVVLTPATPQVDAGYGKLGFSMSASVVSMLGAGGDAGAHYVLAARLDDPKESLFRIAARLHAMANGLKLPKKVSARIGEQRLALADVEARRDALRTQIGRHLKQDRALVFGGAEEAVSVSGLDGPLRISPAGEREMALWLPFKATWGHGATVQDGPK